MPMGASFEAFPENTAADSHADPYSYEHNRRALRQTNQLCSAPARSDLLRFVVLFDLVLIARI